MKNVFVPTKLQVLFKVFCVADDQESKMSLGRKTLERWEHNYIVDTILNKCHLFCKWQAAFDFLCVPALIPLLYFCSIVDVDFFVKQY